MVRASRTRRITTLNVEECSRPDVRPTAAVELEELTTQRTWNRHRRTLGPVTSGQRENQPCNGRYRVPPVTLQQTVRHGCVRILQRSQSMRLGAAFLTLLVAACTTAPVGPPPPASSTIAGVRLSAERVSSSVIRLALDNGAPHQIGYNLCSSALQRRSGSTWEAVGTGDICTMELRTLNPGADATFEKTLPSGLSSGEYRYITNVESPLGTQQSGVATESFRLP